MSDPPLPPGWTKVYSNSQRRYYWHHAETSTSQWTPPSANEARDPLLAKKRAEEKTRKEREEMERERRKRGGAEVDGGGDSGGGRAKKTKSDNSTGPLVGSKVVIIVPYRDLHVEQNRAAHLAQFHPHMVEFLGKQRDIEEFKIFIVEQSDDNRKFNRGKLLNIGFDLARSDPDVRFDVFIFHDVDLLPSVELGPYYSKFPTTPIHIARCWDRYSNNPKYFGGIVSFNSSNMKSINGFPNTFWGWGGEDDEMQKRCEKRGLKWEWPREGTIRDLESMTIQEKLGVLKEHKEWKCNLKWEALEEHEKTWQQNGLADLRYKEEKREGTRQWLAIPAR